MPILRFCCKSSVTNVRHSAMFGKMSGQLLMLVKLDVLTINRFTIQSTVLFRVDH